MGNKEPGLSEDKPSRGGSTSHKVPFAGWCYLRNGKLVGPLTTDELLLTFFRREVDPDSQVFRICQEGREYALLVAPAPLQGTVCCHVTPHPGAVKATDREIVLFRAGR